MKVDPKDAKKPAAPDPKKPAPGKQAEVEKPTVLTTTYYFLYTKSN